MSKMRLGMHEEKWDIWNGTQAWGQAQAMTQHTGGMESSTRHDTTQHTRTWDQAQGMTQHTGGMESSTRHDTACRRHGVKHKA